MPSGEEDGQYYGSTTLVVPYPGQGCQWGRRGTAGSGPRSTAVAGATGWQPAQRRKGGSTAEWRSGHRHRAAYDPGAALRCLLLSSISFRLTDLGALRRSQEGDVGGDEVRRRALGGEGERRGRCAAGACCCGCSCACACVAERHSRRAAVASRPVRGLQVRAFIAAAAGCMPEMLSIGLVRVVFTAAA